MSKNPDFEGYVTYPEYICNKIKGEYLPMVKREVFLKCYFSEGTRRAPGIGHARVIKISKSAYFTKIITRIYDTTIADSITNTKSKTYNEMKQVWKIIIKEQGIDQLIHCPKCFIISILKYIYYSFGAIIRGNKN